ncbi:MAG: DNA-binding NarL/FixJ family response regulator [Saprospiraceae bacterium]|jgi:DNA-binding NarL/FixJ family response regulator
MAEEKKINILLADDHKIFREGLKALLEEVKHLHVMLQAENGIQVIKLLENNTVDLVMMDIHMPLMNGLECIEEIKKSYPLLPVLVLTMAADDIYIKRMLMAGANGYLLKNSGGKELLSAIDTVLKGDQYYSAPVEQIIMNSLKSPTLFVPDEKILSAREEEVLKLIATEHSNGEIANKLFISLRTVDAHKRNIQEKIGAKNIAGVIRYAIKNFNLD